MKNALRTIILALAVVAACIPACVSAPPPAPAPGPALTFYPPCSKYGCDDPSELEDPLCVLTGALCYCDPGECGPTGPMPCVPDAPL